MSQQRDVLRQAMTEVGISQSQLSRLSGVQQPSISQILSGRLGVSDDKLQYLLSCLGFQLEVIRRCVPRSLNRSAERSWRLHRRLCQHLSPDVLEDWLPKIQQNLARVRQGVQGQPHERNLDTWQMIIDNRDIAGLRQVLTGLDTHSVEMREVSPMGGLMSQDERAEVLNLAS